jgi:predicted dehydrogenase
VKSKILSLRAGVIGAGFIGPVHIEALRRLGVSVTALCSTSGRVRASARRLGIPNAFGDYRDMLADVDVDVVHITAPNRFHCEMALAALRAGKHCVCEKPLALNTRESARILKAAKASRTVFALGYNVRFYPAVLALRGMVARGELGEILQVQGSYLQDWLFKETDYNWRLLSRECGPLRAVADIGTHWLDTVSFILGSKLKAVLADLSTWHKTRKRPLGEVRTFGRAHSRIRYASYPVRSEDFASMLLEFENGARGNLGISQVAAGRKNCIRFEIYGSKKSAWWCSESPETLHFGNRDAANETVIRATPVFGAGAGGFMDYPAGHIEGFPDTFKMLFRSIYQTIAAGRKEDGFFATVEDGHQEVAACEAVLRSHRRRGWVNV